MIRRYGILLTITIAMATQGIKTDDPKPQKWESKWKASFTEEIYFPLLGKKATTGNWFYDFNTKQFRVERKSGLRDTYCSMVFPLSNTRCDQIVTNGVRYLHFPEKKYCCKCCTAADGCGVIEPSWTEQGKFVKTGSDDKGTYNSFNVKGFMDNIYEVYNSALREPRRIYQEPRSDMVFNKESYDTKFDGEVFKLPEDSGNCDAQCPLLTFCTLAKIL